MDMSINRDNNNIAPNATTIKLHFHISLVLTYICMKIKDNPFFT